jgi:hypothetical protein
MVRGEILGGGGQLKVSGSNEVFELKAGPTIVQQLKASAGKTVILEGALTPGKEVKTAVPLEVQAVRP